MKRCRYFGPKSQAIIMTTIDKMLTGTLPQDQIYQTIASLLNTPRPWNKPDKNSELAFPLNFVDYVLGPYVAASLIAEDLETTFEAAFAILLKSSDFGDIFNDIDPSAEDSTFRIPSPLHEHTKVAPPVPSRRKEKYEKSHLMISPCQWRKRNPDRVKRRRQKRRHNHDTRSASRKPQLRNRRRTTFINKGAALEYYPPCPLSPPQTRLEGRLLCSLMKLGCYESLNGAHPRAHRTNERREELVFVVRVATGGVRGAQWMVTRRINYVRFCSTGASRRSPPRSQT
ncbi:hypothetical protein FB451DRAFT_1368752 [Mycena latifolia]|nr:hypothetical protein FB451DRAFT_1368752 [Mycena latifolia]